MNPVNGVRTCALNSPRRSVTCSAAASRNLLPGWWRRMAYDHSVLDRACWLKSCSCKSC